MKFPPFVRKTGFSHTRLFDIGWTDDQFVKFWTTQGESEVPLNTGWLIYKAARTPSWTTNIDGVLRARNEPICERRFLTVVDWSRLGEGK